MICIYDNFVADPEYRKAICSWVGGEYSEEQIDFVPSAGEGSSFDKFRKQGRGSKMKTLERYKLVLNSAINDLYISSLKRCQDAIRLYENYFDLDQDKQEIIEKLKT